MIGLIQKIILTLITLLVSVFLGLSLVAMAYNPSVNTDPWLLVPAALCLLSLCSFIFHLKTISHYRNSQGIESIFHKNTSLWYLSLAYGIALIIIAFVFAFQFSSLYDRNIQTEFVILASITGSTLIYGLWLCGDYYTLYKKVNNQKAQAFINQIEEITGEKQLKGK